MGARLVLTVIVLIWVASVLIAFPNLLYAEIYTWTFNDSETRTVCYLHWPDGDSMTSPTDFALVTNLNIIAIDINK